ncbi:MAG TPA: hypothetical protein VNV65_01845 [Candidatus Solibacter sp.]|jgi:hypothetical protein|nr:hypothetical protein [Candidatus Solibacter sp.]
MEVVAMPAGVVLAIVGGLTITRATSRLRRAGAFGGVFWSSFRHFGGYRMRALRPLAVLAFGLLVLAAGLLSFYYGLSAFYAGHLGRISPG